MTPENELVLEQLFITIKTNTDNLAKIEKYIKKGGRLFTLGSDAHNIKEYAYKFDEAKKFLLSKNIKEIILFKDKAIMKKL